MVVARVLGAESYADYATLLALLAFFLILSEGGCNIGLSRYTRDAEYLNARLSLYWTLQYRRWLYTFGITVIAFFIGPIWANSAGLYPAHWQSASFVVVGLLAGVMLHGQLASSALAAAFHHRRILWLAQLMTIFRATLLVLLSVVLNEPVMLVGVLLIAAVIESLLLHRAATINFIYETSPLPIGFVNTAQLHGLAALLDKLTTWLAGGPFLLLILAGIYSRNDLALFAIATDLLQKVLSVAGLPISGLVLPMLHDSRGDQVRFRIQLERLGGLVICWFSIIVGLIASIMPAGIPLVFGSEYAEAVNLAMVWLVPLFVESATRMVWGGAFLTTHQYRWLMIYNLLFVMLTFSLFFFAMNVELIELLIYLGCVKLIMSLAVIIQAVRTGLAPNFSHTIPIIFVSVICFVISVIAQAFVEEFSDLMKLLVGSAVYSLFMLICLKFIPLVPEPLHLILYSLAGKHVKFIKRALATPFRGFGDA